jgi:hypothetical protein
VLAGDHGVRQDGVRRGIDACHLTEAAAAELAEYREIEKRIKGVEANYFGYVTLRWGLAQSRAWIRWADEILRELEARP